MAVATTNDFRLAARSVLVEAGARGFLALFGTTPEVCALAWNVLDLAKVHGGEHKHFLWASMFLKTCGKEAVHCSTAKCTRVTFRKWVWTFVPLISSLHPRVMRLNNRFRGDKGRTRKLSVDGTDCPIQEPHPFSRLWHSVKFNGPGFRYEVACCIQTGDICWINGPFKCGHWPDSEIFKRDLKHLLRAREMVECDSGYRGDPAFRHKHIIFNAADNRAKGRARARQENVNATLKSFSCLSVAWRHDRCLHRFAFGAGAALTQIRFELEGGPRQIYY